jgi:hypothetical protein
VRRTGSRFHWGLTDTHLPQAWAPRWHLLGQHVYLRDLGGWFGGLAGVFRGLTGRELYGLTHYGLSAD